MIAFLFGWSALAVVGYVAHRTLLALASKWDADRLDARRATDESQKIAREDLALRERDVVIRETAVRKPERAKPMPEDLQRRIFAWEDTFAQEDEARTLNDLYAEYQDWDTVRQKVLPMTTLADRRESDRSMVQ